MPLSSVAQEIVRLNVVESHIESPYRTIGAEIVVSAPIYFEIKDHSQFKLPPSFTDIKIYEFGLTHLYSNTIIEGEPFNGRQETSSLLICKTDDPRKLYLCYDHDNDKNFIEEDVDTLQFDVPFFKRLMFSINSTADSIWTVPVEFIASYNFEYLELACRNLSAFKVDVPINDTVFKFKFLVNFWNVNFKFDGIPVEKNGHMPQNMNLDEPFLIDGRLRLFNDLDISKGTVDLITLPMHAKPYGYKEGYYIKLGQVMEASMASLSNERDFDWEESQYYLLYFWGHWCNPCMKRLPEVAELQLKMDQNKHVSMINYPVVIDTSSIKELKNVLNSYNIKGPQLIQIIHPEYSSKEKPTVVSLLNCQSYPHYVLLDKSGKILFRGANRNQELEEALQRLGVF